MYRANFVVTYKDRDDMQSTLKVKDVDDLLELIDDLIAECADFTITGNARWEEE